ncbi:hypothetical protein OB03_12320 [Brevundimonas sp. GN22]|uniref:hypothetical protein n=1 Tax=Brevundimonas pishanensis TaxID=2896315 RepID=UPI001FA74EBE|nr:hypothetical protein [Brevundimonas pishanensis]
MSKFKTILIPVMAVAAFATAMPAAASAQAYGRAPHAAPTVALNSLVNRKATLEVRVDRAMAQRRLDVRDGRDLKRELASIERQIRIDMRGGLQRAERNQLERRLDQIERKLERELRQDHRGPGRR